MFTIRSSYENVHCRNELGTNDCVHRENENEQLASNGWGIRGLTASTLNVRVNSCWHGNCCVMSLLLGRHRSQ